MRPPAIKYFFPKVTAPPPAYADRAAARTPNGAHAPAALAPGVRGIYATPCPDADLTAAAGLYRWDPLPDGVGWLGAYKHAKPADFARPRQFPGSAVTLADGQPWLIPVVNPLVDTCTLPYREFLDAAGEWTTEIIDDYAAVAAQAAELAVEIQSSILEQREAVIEDYALRAAVAAAIALNYDLTLREMSALRLFGPEVWKAVVWALVDGDATVRVIRSAIAAAAKTGDGSAAHPLAAPPPGSATPPGGQATAPTTAPPASTSTS